MKKNVEDFSVSKHQVVRNFVESEFCKCVNFLRIENISKVSVHLFTRYLLFSCCVQGQEAWALILLLLIPASFLIQTGTLKMTSR